MITPEIQNFVRQQVAQGIAQAQQKALYSTTNAASHTHNGIDSPLLATASSITFSAVFGTSGAFNSSAVVTVTNSSITIASIIIFSRNVAAGTLGEINIFAQSAGSVTFSSSNLSDRSTVNYVIFNTI